MNIRPGLLLPTLLDIGPYTGTGTARPPLRLVSCVAYLDGQVGHFVAYRVVAGAWVRISDSEVRAATDAEVFRSAIFMAMYEAGPP